jgi:hypothetical protein
MTRQDQSSSTANSLQISTSSSSTIPYYGSREPKQSNIETDRVIFQMMDDIQIKSMQSNDTEKQQEVSSKLTQNSVLWRFRIVLSSILILLLVVGTFKSYQYMYIYVTLILLLR